jgi:hypothetical protein
MDGQEQREDGEALVHPYCEPDFTTIFVAPVAGEAFCLCSLLLW